MGDEKKLEHYLKEISEFILEVPVTDPHWVKEKEKAIQNMIDAWTTLATMNIIGEPPICIDRPIFFPPLDSRG